MNKHLVFLFFSFLFLSQTFAQNNNATIKGKVINEQSKETIPFANIFIKGTNTGVQSDFEGNFELKLSAGNHVLVASSAGMQAYEKNISISSNEVLEINISLKEIELKAVEVKAKIKNTTANSAISLMKKSDALIQIVSSESIRKSPDANAANVLKRINGLSIQEGKFIIVRGLSDRYNLSMINNMLIGSTEPDRKVFAFDIIPSSVIENIVVHKSYLPELPGEWAGGLVQINTKDIPSENFMNISVGTGFNIQALQQPFYTNQGSFSDNFGIDNTRGLSNNFPSRKAFKTLTQQEKNSLASTLNNNWSITQKKQPMNIAIQINGGATGKVFGKKSAAVLGVNYNNNYRTTIGNLKFFQFNNENSAISLDYYDKKFSKDISAAAFANFSTALNPKNILKFNNFLSVNSNNYVNLRTGKDYEYNSSGANILARELGFKQNIFFNSSLSGEHQFEKSKTKIEWQGSYTLLDQKIPDLKRIQYNQDEETAPYIAVIGSSSTITQKSGYRFFSHLNDFMMNGGFNVSKTINIKKMENTIKMGYLFNYKDRYFNARPFGYTLENSKQNLLLQAPEEIFNTNNINAANGFNFRELDVKQNEYYANSFLHAAYISMNTKFTEKIKLNYGLRMEFFDFLLDAYRINTPITVQRAKLNFLPAILATYSINEKNNIRLGASKTLVRPEFRELAPFTFFDFDLNAGVLGNDNLKQTDIYNADIRYEFYPDKGEIFTVGAFYKYFNNPIEQYFNQSGVNTATYNYQNPESAYTLGFEFEFRKKLNFIKNVTWFGNVAFIKNYVPLYKRSMQGQSPYIINSGFQYDNIEKGWNGLLAFNVAGRRLAYVGNTDVPGIYENVRPLLDFQISKRLMKDKLELKFSANDILNRKAQFYHNIARDEAYFKSNNELNAIERQFGTNISFTIQYRIK